LNVAVIVKAFTLNGTQLGNGTYNASTHPGLLSGTGSITVDSSLSVDDKVFLEYNKLRVKGNLENLEIYNMMGQRVHQTNATQEIDLKWLKSGIYIVRFKVDGKTGAIKFYKN
jgi:hypothetical protein